MTGKPYGRRLMLVALALYALFFGVQFFLHEPVDPAKTRQERAEARSERVEQEKRIQERIEKDPALFRVASFGFLAAMYWGIFFNVYFSRRWLRGEPWPVSGQTLKEPRWGPDDAWTAIAMLFLIELALFAGQQLVWILTGWSTLPDGTMLWSGLLRNGLVMVFIWMLLRKRYGHAFSDLGLKDAAWRKQAGYGLLAYLAILPPLVISVLAVAVILQLFKVEAEPQEVVQVFMRQGAKPFLVALTLFVALVGPVMEEIFFRGFLFSGFRSRYGAPMGAVMSAVVFAALHLHGPAFFPVLLLGLFLAYLYQVSGSLVAPITAHVVHNVLMVAMTFGFKHFSGGSA